MLQLFQAEWCPHSRAVRERLTELGVPFVARHVPAEADDRNGLRERTGSDDIPASIAGDEAILEHLDQNYGDRPDAGRHREKAAEKLD